MTQQDNQQNLAQKNTYKLPAHAKTIYYPSTIDEIQSIYNKHDNVFVLGNGSNVIFTQKVYHRLVFIALSENFNQFQVNDNIITAQAGASLKSLSLKALEQRLSNLEVFYDIPASVGGALWMNAGAYGESIYDYVLEVTALNPKTNQVNTYSIKQIQYSYRYSMFQQSGEIILSAKFLMNKGHYEPIKTKMDHIYELRNKNLPKQDSAGSVFKRPNYHITVGEMVQNLGLKGHQIGGAMISQQHGGIIINSDNASAEDILALIKLIKTKVKNHYDVDLQLEQIPV